MDVAKYIPPNPEDGDWDVVVIGTGMGGSTLGYALARKGRSVLFLADLVRAMKSDVRLAFLGVASYHGTESTGVVRVTHDLSSSIEDQHVLVVEDIVDSGLTLAYIRDMLKVRKPASLRIVSLLDKPEKRTVQVEVEHVGFTIPDAFVVGYGLDLDQQYRNLPYIAVYPPDAAPDAGDA